MSTLRHLALNPVKGDNPAHSRQRRPPPGTTPAHAKQKIADTAQFIIEHGLAEHGEDVLQAAMYLNMGAVCGEICWALEVEGFDSAWYSIGWQAIGITPGADIAADGRDALWLGGEYLSAAFHSLFGSEDAESRRCDAVGLGGCSIAIIPIYGKAADGAQIINHAKRLVKRNPNIAARFARVVIWAMEKVGGSRGREAAESVRGFLRNSDDLFHIYLKTAYAKIGARFAEGIEKTDGFVELRAARRGDLTYGTGLGAHRVFKTLELEKFLGANVVAFGRKEEVVNGVKRKLGTDIDMVIETPDGKIWWVEVHSYVGDTDLIGDGDKPGKAQKLLRAKEVVVNKPDAIHMEIFASSDMHD